MTTKKIKKRNRANLESVQILLEELKTFSEEFDATDPGWTEIMADTHITNLIDRGVVKVPKDQETLRLDDVFNSVFGSQITDNLLERVQTFQDLTNSYRGEPSTEDMEEARDVLDELIKTLTEFVKDNTASHEHVGN
jgi:hypothetical protein